MQFLITAAAFVVALGVLITFHEFGHYLVARLAGVRVLRFAIGFGSALWKKTLGADRTEWVIGSIPLGGYVKMLDEREGEVAAAELHRTFNRQNVWRRFAIVLAGPVANFVLAVMLYTAVFIHGVQELKPVINEPPPQTAAARAGLTKGSTIQKINDEPVATWEDARWRLLQLALAKTPIRLEVINTRQEISWHDLDLGTLETREVSADLLPRLGLFAFRPDAPPIIGGLIAGGAAEQAGLLAGDRILRIDNDPILSPDQVVARVKQSAGRPLKLLVERGKERLELAVTPQSVDEKGKNVVRIGAGIAIDPEAMRSMLVEIRYSPLESVSRAVVRTWDTSAFSVRMMGRMLTGDVSWRNISGPVTIADVAGQSARRGFTDYLDFLALMSISLAILNLLPIPLLDGGNLMYYAIEIVRRRPVSERAFEIGQQVGLFLLLSLMAFAFYNDISRLLSS